jgi:hypothetical protein
MRTTRCDRHFTRGLSKVYPRIPAVGPATFESEPRTQWTVTEQKTNRRMWCMLTVIDVREGGIVGLGASRVSRSRRLSWRRTRRATAPVAAYVWGVNRLDLHVLGGLLSNRPSSAPSIAPIRPAQSFQGLLQTTIRYDKPLENMCFGCFNSKWTGNC